MRELHILLYAGRSRFGEEGHTMLGAGYKAVQHAGARDDQSVGDARL